MSDPAGVAAYRAAFAVPGVAELVTFRRVNGQAPRTAQVDAEVLAVVRDYLPESAVLAVKREGAITQGGKHLIIIDDDLLQKRFPVPLRKNDKVLVRGELLNILTVDPNKRGFAGATEVVAVGVLTGAV